jgi:hypothetical protein
VLVLPDVALTYIVDEFIGSIAPYVHLYMTDTPLTRRTTLADFVELDTPSYAAQRAVAWSPSTIRGSLAVTEADPIRWTRGAGGTPRDVYGYYVTDGVSGSLLWCERASTAPIPMRVLGDRLLVIARWSQGVCVPGITLGTADLVVDAVSGTSPVVTVGLADLVVDGLSPQPITHGLADLLVDAVESSPSPPVLYLADLVGDAVSGTGPPPILGFGELVMDEVVELGPGPTFGLGEIVLDDDELM